MPIDAKRAALRKSEKKLAAVMADNPQMSREEAALVLAREELAKMAAHGTWKDYWFTNPLADPREPEKQACWLTNIKPISDDPTLRAAQLDSMAEIYMKATLTAVDRFFMQVRRAITVAERGIPSASSERRIWFGKNAYNPHYLVMLLDIFRTYFNYCEVGADKKTPAMRLGLARGPVDPEDILYFRPKAQTAPAHQESPTPQTQDEA
jgi:hypothetical protein